MAGQLYNERLYYFSATGADTDGGGVTVTQAAITGEKFVVTGFSASGDKACLVTIESPANTVLWKKRFTGAFNTSEHFTHPVLKGAPGAALLIKVSDGTTNAEADISGYAVKA